MEHVTDNGGFSRRRCLATAAAVPFSALLGLAGPATPAEAAEGAEGAEHPTGGPLAPTGLTVGDRVAPMNVEGHPTFGWRLVGGGAGARQTAYQIQVTRCAGSVGPSAGALVWDSGRITSARQSYVPYGGSTLEGGTSLRWRVRVWDASGHSSWSRWGGFDTGISDSQWAATWIRRTKGEVDDYTLARTEFTVTASPVVRARLSVAACHQYQAYLNGRMVDHGAAFEYPGEGTYQTTDVTSDLVAGARATVGVTYHWYGPGQGRPAGEPGLLVRLVVDHADGSRQIVVSDGTWKVTRGPWLAAAYRNTDGRDYLEHIDGRVVGQVRGWAGPGFDDTTWSTPQVIGTHPAGVFTHLSGQQTRLTCRQVAPVTVTTLASGAVVADFGTVIPAVPVVSFARGVAGATVDLVAGYLLAADGSVSNSTHDNQSTDLSYRYTQRDGAQTFRAFTYVGFRYLQVTNPGEDLTPESLAAIVQHTDVDPERKATFTSSDPTLDAVFALTQRSALYSSQEQFLDTPTREKGQFLADAVNISAALMAGSGDRCATAKAIGEFVASQQRYWPDGRLNAVYPNGDGKRDIPDFTELFPGWVLQYHLASGDQSTLAAAYPVAVAIVGYLLAALDPGTGLVTNLPGGSGAYKGGIVDWPNRYGYDTTTTARTTVNILAVRALRDCASMATVLGRPQAEIDGCTANADSLATAINTRLRRADGIYTDGLLANAGQSPHASQIANAYALANGIVPADTVAQVAGYCASLGLQMGPMTAHTLLAALHTSGNDDQVLTRLTDPGLGWANILAQGGTFTWESWEAIQTGDSLSHGWGATALTSIQQALLGVTLTAPAGVGLRIRPPRGTRLTRAAGKMWTQAGAVSVAWENVDGGTRLTTDLPPNTTARVEVPLTGTAAPKVRGPGAPTARLLGIQDGYASYTLGSGRTTFSPANRPD